jgi:hypothetical protein
MSRIGTTRPTSLVVVSVALGLLCNASPARAVCGGSNQKGAFDFAGGIADKVVEPGSRLGNDFLSDYACTDGFIVRYLSLNDVAQPGSGPPFTVGYPQLVGDDLGEITKITGNAACQKTGAPAGTACNPLNSETECVLPCIVGPAGQEGADDATKKSTIASAVPVPPGVPIVLPVSPTGLVLPGGIGTAQGSVAFTLLDVVKVGDLCPADGFIRDQGFLYGGIACPTVGAPGCDNGLNVFTAPAAVACAIPAPPTIVKDCAACAPETGKNTITATVKNPADGQALFKCSVTDSLAGVLLPSPFDLPKGGLQVVTGVTTVTESTPNKVSGKCENAAGLVIDILPETPGSDQDTCLPCSGDSYKCYAVKPVPRSPRFPGEIVGLEDQFRTTEARLLSPYEICNPADKNGEGIANPDGHLMCYKFLDRSRASSVPVRVTDQFGTEDLRTSSANVLCVPALKNCDPQTESCSIGALEEELNHFQCYGALPLLKDQTLLTPDPVQLVDQFTDGLATFPTSPRRHLCTPTAKNGGSIPNEAQHLKCYNIRDEVPFRGTDINVIDQFGTWELRVGQARELCESAEKTRLDRRPVDDTRSR